MTDQSRTGVSGFMIWSFLFFSLAAFLQTLQASLTEDVWAESLIPVADEFIHSSYLKDTKTKTETNGAGWLMYAVEIYYVGAQKMPAPLLAFFLDDRINFFCNFLCGQVISMPSFKSVMTVTAADVKPKNYHELAVRNKYYSSFLCKLKPTCEEVTQNIMFVTKLVGHQAKLLLWIIEILKTKRLSLPQGDVSADQQPFSEFALIQSFIMDNRKPFCFSSVHALGLATLYKFNPARYDVAEAVRSGSFKVDSPDVHLWLMLHWRSKMGSLVELNRKDRGLVNVKALLENSFPGLKDVANILEFVMVHVQTLLKYFETMDFKPTERTEVAHFNGCLIFILDLCQLIDLKKVSFNCWPSAFDAMVELLQTILVNITGGFPKLVALPKDLITMGNVKQMKDKLDGLEQYSMRADVDCRFLGRIIEMFALCCSVLEKKIQAHGEFIPETGSPILYPYKAYKLISVSISANAKVDFKDISRYMTVAKDDFFGISKLVITKPNDPECQRIRQKYPDIFQDFLKSLPGFVPQPSPNKVAEQFMREGPKNVKGGKKRRPKKNKAASRKAKAAKDPRVVELDENGEEIQPTPHLPDITETLPSDPSLPYCSALALLSYSNSDDDDMPSGSGDDCISEDGLALALFGGDDEETVAVKPKHVNILVDPEDWHLLDLWDPRDIVYSYLLIGNHVYDTFLNPLLNCLSKRRIHLRDLFNTSLESFRMELMNLRMTRPDLFSGILWEAQLQSVDDLFKCLKWYGKRLKITHQYKTLNDAARRLTSEGFISMLYFANPVNYGPGYKLVEQNADAFGFDIEDDLKVFGEPLDRPTTFPCFQQVNFELSILTLNELFGTQFDARLSGGSESVNFRNLRNLIAHARPCPADVRAYATNIYQGHPDSLFLSLLCKHSNLYIGY